MIKPSRLLVVTELPSNTLLKGKGKYSNAREMRDKRLKNKLSIEDDYSDEEDHNDGMDGNNSRLESLYSHSMDNLLGISGDKSFRRFDRKKKLEMEATELAKSKDFEIYAAQIEKLMNSTNITNMSHESDIKQACNSLIQDSVISTGSNTPVHKFNNVINGPRKSGKSVFLSYLYKEVVITMALSKETETNLIIYTDLANTQLYSGIFGFYEFLINLIFDEVEKRRPELEGFKQKFIAHFLSLPGKDRLPPFPKIIRETHAFVNVLPYLEELGGDLLRALQDPFGLVGWFSVVAEIPHRVARAFGFEDILWFIDHFDCVDIAVSPQVPFNEARISVFLIEFAKKMLSLSSYVIATQDDERFFNALPATVEYGYDILSKFKIYSLTDMPISRKSFKNQWDLLIEFAGDFPPLRLRESLCGSCPGYLAIWESIANQIDKKDLGLKTVQSAFIDTIKPFLSLVFDEKTIPPTKIKSVNKIRQNKNTK